MSSIQPHRQTPGPDTSNSVDHVTENDFFPLLFKKVFDVCESKAFEDLHFEHRLLEAERDSKALHNFAELHGTAAAETHGIAAATPSDTPAAQDHDSSAGEKKWNPGLNLYMCTLVAALDRVKATGCGDDLSLQNVIAVGRNALNNKACSPPVDDTDSCSVERVQKTHPIEKVESTTQPDTNKAEVDAVRNFDSTPHSRGVKKPVHAKRHALPDFAKAILERWFTEHIENPYPSAKQKEQLTNICAISLTSVNHWFGNKRMRIKRKIAQRTSQGGERNIDNNLAPSIQPNDLAPRSKWNAVVMSKMTSRLGRDVVADATRRAGFLGENVEVDDEGHLRHVQERIGPCGPGKLEDTLEEDDCNNTK